MEAKWRLIINNQKQVFETFGTNNEEREFRETDTHSVNNIIYNPDKGV